MKIFDTSEGIDILSGTHEHNDADVHHHHFDADPHTWSSPKNVRIIARNMYEAFVSIDPDGEKVFRKNYEELLDEINQVDSVMTERLSPVSGTMFAIYHPSLSYLAKDYNLHQLSLEYNGKEPSAFYLKKAIDIARENNVKVIFIQQEFDAKQAESFASEINAKVVPINPLSYNWSEELLHITDAIAGNKIIAIENVWLSYTDKNILEDINLDIYQGDFLLITGPNGGGKTSLLRTILRLQSPTKGQITFSDKESPYLH